MARMIPLPGVKRQQEDPTEYLRRVYLKAEQDLIREITRKRNLGYVDYAEVASLERVQKILSDMVDETFRYTPKMIEKIFYKGTEKDAAGYKNARTITSAQKRIVEQLTQNLVGEMAVAARVAEDTVKKYYRIARLENDIFRETAIEAVAAKEAIGGRWQDAAKRIERMLKNEGITAFYDKAGRRWSLSAYGNMVTRTTARQAQVAAILTEDDHDLWKISSIGATCPLCAALEGRVYSKSGLNPNYPSLAVAFGKIDANGPDDLDNTYLAIHPNCGHTLVKYITYGKSEEEIQKDIDFSSTVLRPLDIDPRTKKQIKAYQKKMKERAKYLNDVRQWKNYQASLGDKVPQTFQTFRKHKQAKDDTYRRWMLEYRRENKKTREKLAGL